LNHVGRCHEVTEGGLGSSKISIAFANQSYFPAVQLLGIDLAFYLFGLTLIGVAVLHHKTLQVALTGLVAITVYKVFFTGFGLIPHLQHEASDLLNLFGLLLGFALLAKTFEHSGIPARLPQYLPDDWKGGFILLVLVFVISAFLDNIAAAMIGGGVAHVVFRKKVHIGYIAAIVAASNAGGSGSVLGDTTTTMMWIDGVNALDVLHAYAAAVPALFIFGIIASLQQHRHQPILKDEINGAHISWKRVGVCGMILAGAITTNVLLEFPAAGVWVAILVGSFIIKTEWKEVKFALPGTIFLLSLVLCASMMPVEQLPAASWQTACGLGFVSSVFDNIPLTKLALTQGGYDWGVLAYAVGFGGSMIWFGSSAGVAITTLYPEAKSVASWLKGGWHVVMAYVVSFAILIAVMGWHPHAPHKASLKANREYKE
jgi:Na+/H+ antiporter NhaD/arsenite permease-like protein